MLKTVEELKALSPNISFPENWMELLWNQLNDRLEAAIKSCANEILFSFTINTVQPDGYQTFGLNKQQINEAIKVIKDKGYNVQHNINSYYTISGW